MLMAFRAGRAADGASLRDRFGWWWDGQARIECGDAEGQARIECGDAEGQARIECGDAEGPVQSVQLAIRGSVAR